ncbi:adenylosuccinate lyase [Thermodesulfobacteriota bacterium]
MISRYTRREMGKIWEPRTSYAMWLEVEILACEAMMEEGLISNEAFSNIKRKASFSEERIQEIEKVTRHDVIAFLTNVAEYVGPDSRFIHMGLTSSDILDTSFALQLKEAMTLIIAGVTELMETIEDRAQEHKYTAMIGRSHGVHAEPITFGLKLAVWYTEMGRNLKRLEDALEVISYGKISGAVGTFANISPKVEAFVCEKLGLKPAEVSTQIIQRDRHAEYFTSLSILAGTLEKISIELRHLQRSEVLEVEEPFEDGQKGSSAMPHKKNPIGAENISGLARLVRSNSIAAMENIALWHERDISHSSVERVIAPDSTVLIDFMVHRLNNILKNLVVHPRKMEKNLNNLKGLIFSQQVLMRLTSKGLKRQQAYEMVQRNALKVWDTGDDFKELLLDDEDIKEYINQDDIEEIFSLDYHFKHVEEIFNRVFI